MKKTTILFLSLLVLSFSFLFGAEDTTKNKSKVSQDQKTKKIAAGPHYWRTGFAKFFLGKDYRNLWTLPIELEILDLKNEAGGLSPVMTVGGQQTKGLALKGADGRSYTFRGIDKDPSEILAPELQGTIADRAIQDQMSSAQPAGPLVAEVLMNAAGILTTPIKLVVMPDDPSLGEYRSDFAGLMGTFQEFPTVASRNNPGFTGITEVLDYQEMWKLLEESPRDRVDSKAYLKARLLDLLIGDWDRHRKQWRWANLPGKISWQPIPEDRDQVFTKYDGLLLSLLRFPLPYLLNFGENYSGIYAMTFGSGDVDRYLLTDLQKQDWKTVAQNLKTQLSDTAIEEAVKRLPREYYQIEGPRLEAALKKRRDNLLAISNQFYELLAHQVDIYMTHQSEHVIINRIDNNSVEIRISAPSPGESSVEPYYNRRFFRDETHEIRLHLLGGDDNVVSQGGPTNGILIRVIGGQYQETIDDSKGGRLRIYDFEGTPKIKSGTGTKVNKRPYTMPILKAHTPWVPPQDWGHFTIPLIWFGGGPDIGAFIGAGFNTKTYGFRKVPFSTSHNLRAGYASLPQSFKFDYMGEFHVPNSQNYFNLKAFASGIEVLRFFGFGNETKNEKSSEYYRVRQVQYILNPSFTMPLSPSMTFSLGPTLKYSRTKQDEDRIIAAVTPYGANNFGQLGFWGRFNLETNIENDPNKSGIHFFLEGRYFPTLLDVESSFGSIQGNISANLTASSMSLRPTLALRLGGKQIFGNYPFHEAAFIGGGGLSATNATVRGYRSQRFAGDSSLYGNAELRFRLSNIYIFFPGEMGLFGLGDVGRVFLKGEESNTWHTAVGGGLWFSFLEGLYIFSIALANSEEELSVYVRAGFNF